MTGIPDEGTMTAYLALVMLVGAANADADPTQRAMLRERVLPPLKDKSLTGQEARRAACDAIVDIMGDQWEPKGEWRTFFENLIPELREGR
jgi:hypothetical protein